jgi:hypothetical protein
MSRVETLDVEAIKDMLAGAKNDVEEFLPRVFYFRTCGLLQILLLSKRGLVLRNVHDGSVGSLYTG